MGTNEDGCMESRKPVEPSRFITIHNTSHHITQCITFILSGNISVTDCGSFSSSKDTEWMVIVQSVTVLRKLS